MKGPRTKLCASRPQRVCAVIVRFFYLYNYACKPVRECVRIIIIIIISCSGGGGRGSSIIVVVFAAGRERWWRRPSREFALPPDSSQKYSPSAAPVLTN